MQKKRTLARRIQLWISFLLRVSLVVALLHSIYFGYWMTAFLAVQALFFSFFPSILARNFRIFLPTDMEFLVVLFVYGSVFLGNVHRFYDRYPWWDTLLHGVAGITLGFIGFIFLYILYSKQRVKASAFVLTFFSFCFAVALGALWEVVEYVIDSLGFAEYIMQVSLADTMGDLILDASGALIMSYFGYLYIRYDRGKVVKKLIENFVEKNPQLFQPFVEEKK